ncbi:threonine--tRNA ligase [Gulosibacter molinativorax]|uniref:Threonine--tRNA ligase n=2 Tax=Gulosibacter molinativorax TaxID=256821 RepID=A0ABT7C754_9MICO|nr:threonine--tRNA ligase [Gulosibacter molinativorax]QUY61396.1 Threonine--tRNA ligase [Gulosibacter molinativorax]
MSQFDVKQEAAPLRVEATTTTDGFTLFQDAPKTPAVVAMRVDGQLLDLFREVEAGQVAEAVTIESEDGMNILRHSAAHVTAQAVQKLFPGTKLGIGPFIKDGFYYDFDVDNPFTPEDLKAIEKEMKNIVKQGQRFARRSVSDEAAREELANEPYKLELVSLKGGAGSADNENVEVGEGELTIYDNVDAKSGETCWSDLCRGPHLPSTRLLGNGWSLLRSSGAYWRGSEKNPMLQRIYGTAWATKDELVAYKTRLEEAAKRDHRKLGVELDLFSFPDEIGSGLAVFHPKGGIIRHEIETFMREQLLAHDYELVNTPHITKSTLFETSQHLNWYKDGMFPAMHLDEVTDDEGNVTKPGQDYYLKPMNCPFHNLIFRSRARSYRELPLRLAEFGTVYRYEKSGTLSGLTRVRGLTQDDAHIYVTEDQVKDEIKRQLEFVFETLRAYGLNDFYLELSTQDPEKSVGTDAQWRVAEDTLREVGEESGLELVDDPAGAAFYGPKISVQARDAIGRTWQLSTVQLDFNQPQLFELEYAAADGTRKQPLMIHRALLGSIERFFAILLEHYAGAFPVWLSPEQVVGIPVADEYAEYLGGVIQQLKGKGVRAKLDDSDDRMPKKIRTHTKSKVPFQLIAGEEDRSNNAVSFRFRDGSQRNGVPVAEAIELITGAIEERKNVNAAEDL